MKFKQMLEFYKDRSCNINMRDNGRIELTYFINPEGKHKRHSITYNKGRITEVYDDFVVFERKSTHSSKDGSLYVLNHIYPSHLITITRVIEQAEPEE